MFKLKIDFLRRLNYQLFQLLHYIVSQIICTARFGLCQKLFFFVFQSISHKIQANRVGIKIAVKAAKS